jgi:hypothetical protein
MKERTKNLSRLLRIQEESRFNSGRRKRNLEKDRPEPLNLNRIQDACDTK